jgi:hypothetical protein
MSEYYPTMAFPAELDTGRLYIAPPNATREQTSLEWWSRAQHSQIGTRADLKRRLRAEGVVIAGKVFVGLGHNDEGEKRLNAVASAPTIEGKLDPQGDIVIRFLDVHRFFYVGRFLEGGIPSTLSGNHRWDGIRIPDPKEEIMNPHSGIETFEEVVEMFDTIPLTDNFVDPSY